MSERYRPAGTYSATSKGLLKFVAELNRADEKGYDLVGTIMLDSGAKISGVFRQRRVEASGLSNAEIDLY
jgi:hypothetical protein